jgi:predicted cupin superfamily sugar epimerase
VGSALYFLVTPGAPVRLHRIRNDQLYHYYLGDPLEVFLLNTDGATGSSSDQTCAAASAYSCSSRAILSTRHG